MLESIGMPASLPTGRCGSRDATHLQFGPIGAPHPGGGGQAIRIGNSEKPGGRRTCADNSETHSGSRHTYPSPTYLSENTSDLLAKMQSGGVGFIIFFCISLLYGYYVQ